MNTPAVPFHILLLAPEIPANTGNIARTCLATGAHLHLVKPLGFSIDDRTLLRAGLDYWKEVNVSVWDTFEQFLDSQPDGARNFFLTTKTQKPYYAARFQPGDTLIFGRETKGLPESLLAAHPEQCLTIPMSHKTRSLNLSVSVGIVLYEAIRQQAIS
jgi:tRNA (cytidine/uridine-2'-O-)-methyltransferase